MEPLFNKDRELVGWINSMQHIFDTERKWIAYISDGHAWSVETGNWCGPVPGLICLDKTGRVVAWNPKQQVAGTERPSRPARATRPPRPARPPRPPRPARPARPPRPYRGWSKLTFVEWVSQ